VPDSCLTGPSIQEALILWGRGKAMADAPNGYQTPSLFHRPSRSVLSLSPEIHSQIDQVVSALRLSKPQHYEIICRAYVHLWRDGRIARELRRSRSWVRETRIAAEYYLEAKLEETFATVN